MAKSSSKTATSRGHIFFLLLGIVIVVWGFVSMNDVLKQPLLVGADWQIAAVYLLVGGLIVGAAATNMLRSTKNLGRER